MNEELRIRCAEAVGWEFVPSQDRFIGGIPQAVPDSWIDPNGDVIWHDMPIPRFDTDHNACFTILVEDANRRGWTFRCTQLAGEWFVTAFHDDVLRQYSDKSICVALCRVFLATVEADSGQQPVETEAALANGKE